MGQHARHHDPEDPGARVTAPANLIDGRAIARRAAGGIGAPHRRVAGKARHPARTRLCSCGRGCRLEGLCGPEGKGLRGFVHPERDPCARRKRSENELLAVLAGSIRIGGCTGFWFRRPCRRGSAPPRVYSSVLPEKDVDGFHPMNVGKLMLGDPADSCPALPPVFRSCWRDRGTPTPAPRSSSWGAETLWANQWRPCCARRTGTRTRRSPFATPARAILRPTAAGRISWSRPLVCRNLSRRTWLNPAPWSSMWASTGLPIRRPKAARAWWVMSISPACRSVAGAITPNPGGVGPMTIAMLMQNTVRAAEKATTA